jgi:HSP20 family protein
VKEDGMDRMNETGQRRMSVPACTISEEAGIVTARLEMPGVTKEGLEIKVQGNELSVSGERAAPPSGGNYLLRERSSAGFRKVFTLDDTIAHDKIEAKLENGVLSLRLHVKEAAKPRRIEIG